jgi:hypothetical protein
MKNSILLSLHKLPQTVFTLQEISLLFSHVPYINLKKRMSYSITSGALQKLRRGVYAKESYNILELANKLYAPSYISLETVLQKAGITFQYYERTFVVSYLSRTVEVDGHTFEYHKIRDDILTNNQGIDTEGLVNVASPERAFLDTIFLHQDYPFDNLSMLQWDTVLSLQQIYKNSALAKRVNIYYQHYKEDHA